MTPNIPAPGSPEEHKAHPTCQGRFLQSPHWKGAQSCLLRGSEAHTEREWEHPPLQLRLISSILPPKGDYLQSPALGSLISQGTNLKLQQWRWMTKKTKYLSLFFKFSINKNQLMLCMNTFKVHIKQRENNPGTGWSLWVLPTQDIPWKQSGNLWIFSIRAVNVASAHFQIKLIKLRHQIWTTEVFLGFGLVLLWFLCC